MLNRFFAILTLSLALLVAVGASAQEAPSPAEAAAEAAAAEAAAEASAAPGCTAPSAEGCATCCRPLANGMCTQLSWTGGADSEAVPWYNAQKALGKACPPDCRKCAQCLERDRDTLAKMKRPEGCACDPHKKVVDPCHSPMSCACFCSRYERLAAKCVDGGMDDDDSSSEEED